MTEKSQPKPNSKGGISRRSFLKLSAAALPGLLIPGAGLLLTGERHEPENFLSPILMVDFAPGHRVPGIIQTEYPNNRAIIRRALGNEYISRHQIITEFGRDIFTEDRFITDFYNKYPRAAVIYGVVERFANHGEMVADAMRKTWERRGVTNSVYLEPLQNAMDYRQATFRQDELGNLGFFVQVEPEPIIAMLKKHPNQKIVNFSFTFGEVGFWVVSKSKRTKRIDYPAKITSVDHTGKLVYYLVGGNGIPISKEEYQKLIDEMREDATEIVEHDPWIKEVDPYDGVNAEANITKLFRICWRYPDRLFLVAAGNYSTDLRPLRQKMADRWPSNVLLEAEWDSSSKQPVGLIEGADLYVDNTRSDLANGGSVSVGVVSAVAAQLYDQGLEIQEIKRKLFSMTHIESFERSYINEPDQKIRVFDP